MLLLITLPNDAGTMPAQEATSVTTSLHPAPAGSS